jgi:hypothetical protein
MVDIRRNSFKATGETLLPQIRRHAMREAAVVDPDRDMSFVHPSEMVKADWCPRRPYFRITGEDAKNVKPIGFQLANVFAEGHAIHRRWQSWLRDMGILWGKWKCMSCDDVFFALSPDTCRCGGKVEYREVPLYSEKHHIIGHADGAVLCEDGVVRLIEIKSVGIGTIRFEAPSLFKQFTSGDRTLDELWSAISRPLPSHLKQGNLYLSLASECHEYLKDTDEIIFLYEWKPTQAAREFKVKYNPDLVSSLLEDAHTVGASVRAGSPPEHPHWASAGGPVCKSCEYVDVCWGSKEPRSRDAEETVKRGVKRSTGAKRRKVVGPSK